MCKKMYFRLFSLKRLRLHYVLFLIYPPCSVCIYYIRTMGVARKRLAIILRRRIQAEGMEKALIAKLVGRDRTD